MHKVIINGQQLEFNSEKLDITIKTEDDPDLNLRINQSIIVNHVGSINDLKCNVDVKIDTVDGNAHVEGDCYIENEVGGSVKVMGDLNCGDIQFDAEAGGDIKCGEIGRDAKAGGDIKIRRS